MVAFFHAFRDPVRWLRPGFSALVCLRVPRTDVANGVGRTGAASGWRARGKVSDPPATVPVAASNLCWFVFSRLGGPAVYRQADVLLVPVAAGEVPPTAVPAPRDRSGRMILARGEATGHAHVIVGPDTLLLADRDDI